MVDSKKRGTIVFVGGMEMPDKNAAAHYVMNSSKLLSELGYSIVWCGVDKNIKNNSFYPQKMGKFWNYPAKYPINSKEWVKYVFDFSFVESVLKMQKDLKYIVCYNSHAIHLSHIIRFAHKKNVKVIVAATEWYENKFSARPIKLIKWIDTFFSMRFFQKKADGIISISTYLTNYYKKSVANIVTLPPTIDFRDKIWHIQDILADDEVSFVYAGSGGTGKDKIDLIISAFATLLNEKFVFRVIGITKDQFLQSYGDCTTELLELGDRIVFLGRVSHQESIGYLLKSDYTLIIRDLSRKNMAGFPTKFVEAATCGVGIIANNFSNISDFYPLENSILLNSISKEAIAESILQSIRNGKICHKANDTFAYENFLQRVESFLDDLEK